MAIIVSTSRLIRAGALLAVSPVVEPTEPVAGESLALANLKCAKAIDRSPQQCVGHLVVPAAAEASPAEDRSLVLG